MKTLKKIFTLGLGLTLALTGCSVENEKKLNPSSNNSSEKQEQKQELPKITGKIITTVDTSGKEKFTYWTGETTSTLKLESKAYRNTYAYIDTNRGTFTSYDDEGIRNAYRLDDTSVLFSGKMEFVYDNYKYELNLEMLGNYDYFEVKNLKGENMFYLETSQTITYDNLHNITDTVFEVKMRSENYEKFGNGEIKFTFTNFYFFRTPKGGNV